MNNKNKLLRLLTEKQRLLTEEEIVEFYHQNVQRKYCHVGPEFYTRTGKTYKNQWEYDYAEIKGHAETAYSRILYRLIKSNEIIVIVP